MLSSDNAAPTFTYGTTGVFQGAARFFTTIGNLDPSSNYNADGTITLVLPKETFRSQAVCTGPCGPLNPGTADQSLARQRSVLAAFGSAWQRRHE